MPLRYTVEQLLRLRTSPLVCKPEKLPPLEEWMGSPADQKQRGLAPPRGRLDDHSNQSEKAQKRPSLLNVHHLTKKSSTAPEDIILGPPKTAFASAHSRNPLKSTSADAPEESLGSNKRSSFHERTQRDREPADGEKRESTYNGSNSRRLGRDDWEDWQSNRQRRHHDQEEGDARVKRNGDKDRRRWDRDSRDTEVAPDTRRISRDVARREGRGKLDQPWFRGDKAQDGGDDSIKPLSKQDGWRKERGSGRGSEWDRPANAEQDPEWMDSTASAEPTQVHTQEEFQRWKESMKAGAEGQERPTERQGTAQPPEVEKIEPPPMPTFLAASEVESGMDKFFAFYGDRKMYSEQKPAEVKSHRKPRFAALFSPQPEQDGTKGSSFAEQTETTQDSNLPTSQAAPASIDENKADQEHFQRVLQMLAGRSSNNTPQSAPAPKPSDDGTHIREVEKPREEPKSLLAETLQKPNQARAHEDMSGEVASPGINEARGTRLMEPQQQRIPREPTPNRDADLLLRLMQQSRISRDPRPSQASRRETSESAVEPLPFRSISGQAPTEKLNNHRPPFFDDPAISQMQRPEQAPHRDRQQRRPMNGPPNAFFDEHYFNDLRQTSQQLMVNPGSGAQPRVPNLPPGMQRPPGFDQMTAPPMAWQNRPQQQGPHNGMNPPPGIPNPSGRAMNAAFVPGPAVPPSHLMPLSPQHMPPQRQRKYTGDGAPGYPLGMGPAPPPGFMNAPPPGFPSMPPVRAAGPGQQLPDGNGMLPRHLMDMLASGHRGDGRDGGGGGGGGGGGIPGNYL